MGLFRKKDDSVEQIRGLRDELEAMAQRLDRSEAEKEVLVEHVSSLEATIDEQRDRLADLALVTTSVHGDESLRSQIGKVAERMGALDGRVNQISTELVNQLDELGGELDALGRAIDANDVTAIEAKLDAVATGQTRLANEQARYEIKFREDLAEVAERLRRPSTR